MHKKILVLGRRNVGEKNDALQLADALARHSDLAVTGGYYEDIVLDIQQDSIAATIHHRGSQNDIASFDVAVLINWSHNRLYSDIAHSLAMIMRAAGKAVWNEELIGARSSTKLSQLVELSGTGIALPKTLFSLTPELVQSTIEKVGSPFVAKDPLASRGRSNFLCASWDEFTAKRGAKVSYLLQEYIPNDHSDLRMFVLAMKPELAILRRGSDESHLNNISAGANAELVDMTQLPSKLLRDTEIVAQHFRRNLCGIDFMRNTETDEYVFLEINTTPQIVNGAFVEQKIDALVSALKNEEK